MVLILCSYMLTERTVFVICLSRVMVVSRVTPKILTVELAIIVSVPTTKGVFTDTGLLEEWKINKNEFVNFRRTVAHSQTGICNAVF